MNKFFGIEKYCRCVYHGEDTDENRNAWFANRDNIPLWNGFDFDHFALNKQEIFDIKNEDKYFEIILENSIRYFKTIDLRTPMMSNYLVKDYYKSVDFLVKYNIDFLFIIEAGDYAKINNIVLSDKILKLVKDGHCKILLNTSYEPYSTEKPEFAYLINNFAIKYNLNKDNLKILSGNLIADKLNTERYEFLPYCYFLENPWFMEKDTHFHDDYPEPRKRKIRENIEEKRKFFLLQNRLITKFDKKILCYNRRAHTHRRLLFYHLYHDQLIKDNIYLSLNNNYGNRIYSYALEFGVSQDESNSINEFFLKLNDIVWSFDGNNLDINLANNFDEDYHKKTFVSVVSETNAKPQVIFFSEKIFKPIYACQPFIISGNQYSLKKLKEFGFKTFDKWWDESYDEEFLFIDRVEKIKIILREISLKTDEELHNMLIEMEEILNHNFNVFVSYTNNHLNSSLSIKSNIRLI